MDVSRHLPPGYLKYGHECTKIHQLVFGDRDSALLRAQIEAESYWDPTVCSPAGACGLTQFIPSTRAGVEEELGITGDIFKPKHACLLQAHLMFQLARQLGGLSDGYLGSWAMAMRGYNGSPRTLLIEYERCGRPRLWTELEAFECRARSVPHFKENTSYPHKIINRWWKYFWTEEVT